MDPANPTIDPAVTPPADPLVTPPPAATPPAETAPTAAELEAERIARADLQKRLDAYEAADQARKDKELTEAQREKKRADEAEAKAVEKDAKIRRATILDAARDEAEKQGLKFAPGALADAFKLGDFDKLDVDDKDNVKGIADTLKTIASKRAHFLQTVTPAKAPDIGGPNKGRNEAGELTDDRKAELRRRFRLGR